MLKDDSGIAVVAECVAALEQVATSSFFPEGTRTPLSGEIRLRRGAANIAVRGLRDITPVIIAARRATLTKG